MRRPVGLVAIGAIGLIAVLTLGLPAFGHAAGAFSEAGQAISDSALTAKVKTVLATDKVAKKYKVHVSTKNGRVTLTGHVGSEENSNHLKSMVQSVSGVSGVNDELQTP